MVASSEDLLQVLQTKRVVFIKIYLQYFFETLLGKSVWKIPKENSSGTLHLFCAIVFFINGRLLFSPENAGRYEQLCA